ncbi:hypothetical protein ACFFMN_29645 [Planobispora siamensis]|uniref:Uncharacterized protein n=1 Tax=Planobispora siamensis TaxID=936338 RepID=A0A8J3SEK3_9ACTN|nr:hypothetical protein [Planobispora siamensis]GIH91650.1 hypothetical protein Psi01_22800 [Planobispora siamensis]
MAEIIKVLITHRIQRYPEWIADVEDDERRIRRLKATEETWAVSRPDAIALNAIHWDEILIKCEFWDGEPLSASDWHESRSGSVHLASGKIRAISSRSGYTSDHEEFRSRSSRS